MATEPRAFVICRSASDPRRAFSREGISCRMCSEPLVATDAGMEHIVQFQADPLCNRCGSIVLRALGPANVDIEVGPEAAAIAARQPVPTDLMELVSRYTRAANASAN